MSWFKSKFTVLLLSLFVLSTAHADDLVLNGSAVFKHLTRDQYIGGLYLPQASEDINYILSDSTTKRMQIVVTVPSWSPRRWSQIWQNNIAINNDNFSQDPAVQQALMTFTSFPRSDIKAGDEIVIDYQPGGNSRILLNNDLVVEASGTTLFNYLVNTWIGKLPPTREFRNQILGQEASSDSHKETLLSHQPKRPGLFTGWIAAEQATRQAEQARIEAEQARIRAERERIEAEKARQAAAEERKRVQLAAAARQAELELQRQKVQATPKVVTANKAETADKKPEPKPVAATQTKAKDSSVLEEQQLYHLNMLQWQLQRQVRAAVVYPAWAKQFGQEGLVELDFTLNKHKEVSDIKVSGGNSSDLLVNEVKRAVNASASQMTIPKDLTGDSWPVSVSYLFSLQNKPQPELVMPTVPASLQQAKPSESSEELETKYIQAELERIAGNVVYPAAARILKKQGLVTIEFDLSKDGKVLEIRDIERSKHRELNQAAHEAVKNSEPYPPLPIGLKKESLTLTFAYDFKL